MNFWKNKPKKPRKPLKAKDLIRMLVLAAVAAVIGVNVYHMNAARLTGDTVPMPFGVGASVVLSGSMEPELSVGDLLIIARQDSYEANDVVVYQTGRTSVVHRIVSIDGDTVITKGDANNAADAPILLSNIKGEVACVIPLAGHIIRIIKTPIATLILLILAVWLLESSFKKDKKKEQETLDALRSEIDRLKKEQNK